MTEQITKRSYEPPHLLADTLRPLSNHIELDAVVDNPHQEEDDPLFKSQNIIATVRETELLGKELLGPGVHVVVLTGERKLASLFLLAYALDLGQITQAFTTIIEADGKEIPFLVAEWYQESYVSTDLPERIAESHHFSPALSRVETGQLEVWATEWLANNEPNWNKSD